MTMENLPEDQNIMLQIFLFISLVQTFIWSQEVTIGLQMVANQFLGSKDHVNLAWIRHFVGDSVLGMKTFGLNSFYPIILSLICSSFVSSYEDCRPTWHKLSMT